MTELMQASNNWASRPADERFASLHDMQTKMRSLKSRSDYDVHTTRHIEVAPVTGDDTHRKLQINLEGGPLAGMQLEPNHWSFGQLCSLASPGNSPAGYFRDSKLPAEVIADCLNYNLTRDRSVESVGILGTTMPYEPGTHKRGAAELRAATGPNYGRVWNADTVDMLVDRFGDGVTGDWRVPGEFGKRVNVTKDNTTLFASDRDMFVFLADEDRRIEVAGRSLARGFFVWNSEVGDKTLGAGFFLFDYVCCNRIVWGANQYTEVRIRHTKGAPDRWLDEVVPVLREYDLGSPQPVIQAIEHARAKKVDDDLDTFLANRFTRRLVEPLKAIHLVEEGRPIENHLDIITAATAHARSIPNTDQRLLVERAAGELLQAV